MYQCQGQASVTDGNKVKWLLCFKVKVNLAKQINPRTNGCCVSNTSQVSEVNSIQIEM